MGKISKKMVKRPRADKHKGKKSDQRALGEACLCVWGGGGVCVVLGVPL
jgi:hypothetical protein